MIYAEENLLLLVYIIKKWQPRFVETTLERSDDDPKGMLFITNEQKNI